MRWVGGSGRTVAVAHIDGSVATYDVPTAEPGGGRLVLPIPPAQSAGPLSSIAAIVRTRVTFPPRVHPPRRRRRRRRRATGLSNTVCRTRLNKTLNKRRTGRPSGSPSDAREDRLDGWANSRAPTGAVLCVGGESVGAVTDPARIVSLRGWRDGDEGEGEGEGDDGMGGMGKTGLERLGYRCRGSAPCSTRS